MPKAPMITEDEFIARFLRPLVGDMPGSFHLADDAALIDMSPGKSWVISSDMLVGEKHFFADMPPDDIAYRALAVNVSDILAKGANPKYFSLNLGLPSPIKAPWAENFVQGLKDAKDQFSVQLIGGDLVGTGGPFVISISIYGEVIKGDYLSRLKAKEGDRLYVTGAIGLGAIGLETMLAEREQGKNQSLFEDAHLPPAVRRACKGHFLRPKLAKNYPLLSNLITASMDLSDGLYPDLVKFCTASNVGADVQLSQVPTVFSQAETMDVDGWSFLLNGGDDYQFLCTVDEKNQTAFELLAKEKNIFVTKIGQITAHKHQINFFDHQGQLQTIPLKPYQHF